MQLNITHSDKNRAEAFLRILNEKLEQVPFDWKSLAESSRIDDAVKLIDTTKSLQITILFVKSYTDANLIAKANFTDSTIRWGQNGYMMYVVESTDAAKTSHVLGTFAGEE